MQYLTRLAGLTLGLGLASQVFAQSTVPTYNIVNNYDQPIEDIMMFWQAPASGYGPGSFNGIGGTGITIGANSTGTITDLPKPVPPTGELLLGVVTDPAIGAQAAQEHLVMFMNSTQALASQDIAFGTLFPHTNEDQIIADLQTVSNPSGDTSSAYSDLFNFANGDSQHIPSGSSPTGTTTAWLTPAGNNVATPGSIVMFSNGTTIGSFTATNVVATPTPSPETYSVFGFGLLGFCVVRRRKRTHR